MFNLSKQADSPIDVPLPAPPDNQLDGRLSRGCISLGVAHALPSRRFFFAIRPGGRLDPLRAYFNRFAVVMDPTERTSHAVAKLARDCGPAVARVRHPIDRSDRPRDSAPVSRGRDPMYPAEGAVERSRRSISEAGRDLGNGPFRLPPPA